MSGTIDMDYQRKIDEIAEKEVYWFGGKRINQDLDAMLAFLLAKQPRAEKIVREKLDITDEDFRRALGKAAPGLFIYESHWEEVNRRFGIDPPLPFPVLDWDELYQEYKERVKQEKVS